MEGCRGQGRHKTVTEEEIREMLAKAGFEDIETHKRTALHGFVPSVSKINKSR